MSTSSVSSVAQQTTQASTDYDAWSQVDLDDFINLLVTELQNQDPLDPMNNQEILQQVSQIREIESTQRLTETLESVLLGQNVATAGNLLGQTIVGLSDSNEQVSGEVDAVTIQDGTVKLHVGEHAVDLGNLMEIQAEGEDAEV
jgi:flagellar basal-body rod modification protein FlgD